MYRYLALAAIVFGVLAPAAFAEEGPSQPSAIERLTRQEDARWSDPRLGITYPSAWQPSAIERLVRQEDARAAQTPTVQIVSGGGFDWLVAAIGAATALATALLACGLAIVARSRRLERAQAGQSSSSVNSTELPAGSRT